jgi:NAD(P)-dependent dehydrogenase (short-subunit alcohol dehydrogenase family)
MRSFGEKLAVVTGGGSGMGRELVAQLAAQGCSVATCDLNLEAVEEAVSKAQSQAPEGTSLTSHICDVSDEEQVLRFRDEVVEMHNTDHVDLLFNNAGIGGGGSFVVERREPWERTFAVDWWGVYYCSRAFVPLLLKSKEGYLVNTSSVNGFWASLGPGRPHTAYSAAKFAVKGFSEALIEDFRVHAPHVKVAVVMPGHIGTDIFRNSRRAHGQPDPENMGEAEVEEARVFLSDLGVKSDELSADDVRALIARIGDEFRDHAPSSAAEAARIILEGVRNDRWRILVGKDAEKLDAFVRANAESAYDPDVLEMMALRALDDSR